MYIGLRWSLVVDALFIALNVVLWKLAIFIVCVCVIFILSSCLRSTDRYAQITISHANQTKPNHSQLEIVISYIIHFQIVITLSLCHISFWHSKIGDTHTHTRAKTSNTWTHHYHRHLDSSNETIHEIPQSNLNLWFCVNSKYSSDRDNKMMNMC